MRRLAAFLALLLAASPVRALDPTASEGFGAQAVIAPFLARAASARTVAMGAAFTAVSDDATAVLGNPGGLGRVSRLDALAQYETDGDGLSRNVAALSLPVGPGSIGLGVATFSAGSYEVRDASGNKSGDESTMDLAVCAGYGFSHPAIMKLHGWTGVSVEFVSQGGGGGSLIAASLGTVVPLGSVVDLGLALQHLGGKADGFGLPAALRGGLSIAAARSLRVAVDARSGLNDKVTDAGAGAEWVPIPKIAVRAGYRRPLSDQGWQGLSGLTAGAGLKLNKLVIDYAFQPYGELASAHLISVSWRESAWIPAPTVAGDTAEAGAEETETIVVMKVRKPTTQNIAVSDLEPQGVSASDAAVIADMLRGELVKTGEVNVLERQNMQKVMAEQAFQQTGCTSAECAVKLGKLLNVNKIVTGSVGKLGDMYFVNVRIVDVETASMIWSDRAEAKVVSALAREIPSLAQRLAKKAK